MPSAGIGNKQLYFSNNQIGLQSYWTAQINAMNNQVYVYYSLC